MFGYVFYPDGGCHPQHEYSGAGIHGYRWNLSLTAKGIGHTSQAATFRGYVPKAESFDLSKDERNALVAMSREEFQQWILQDSDAVIAKPYESLAAGKEFVPNQAARVTIERYYDSFRPLAYGGTNNTAEMYAAIHCLEFVVTEPDFDKAATIIVRQDNMLVIDGVNRYLETWLKNNFVRPNGTEIANKEIWIRLNAILTAIRERGVQVIFEWVRGHGADMGNNSADELATAARITARSAKETAALDPSFRVTEPTAYWASRSETRHPFLCQRYLYIGVDAAEEERREYYLSTQGKIAEMNGKRTSDDGFSVVRIGSQPAIEDIVAKQASLPREIDYKFQIDLDNVYGASTRYLDLYGTNFLHRAVDHKRHLQTYGKVLVTSELHPPYLCDRMFDNTDMLADFLNDYKKEDQPSLTTTDITGDFFEVSEVPQPVKKGDAPLIKTVCTLKSEIIVGYFKHATKGRWKEDGEIKECDVTLRLGVDLPDRNALRRLEEFNPKVYLVTNTLGPGSFMYAVVIEAGADVGIWSGINSSIRVTAKPAKAKTEKKTA